MKILFIGDIFGEPGRNAIKSILPDLIRERNIDFVVANGENAAGGRGITPRICDELFEQGIDVITSGNHIWDQRQIIPYISEHPRLIRPANYPSEQPGTGSIVVTARNDVPVGVINAEGQLFVDRVDCPFRAVDRELNNMRGKAEITLVDIHAEASSERRGMGWHLAGRITAVIGTHTHIPTADAQILPGGTAYISDVGMTGPYDSVIGMDKDVALRRLIGHFRDKFIVAKGDTRFCAVMIEADEQTSKATGIERIEIKVE
jgi:metallophosphoesterase (TIGR00282 family)